MIATFPLLAVALQAAATSPLAAARRDPAPGFDQQSLELPGMPAAVLPADMNGDGRDDLVVLVAYTAWGDVATSEQVEFDDIEGLVEVMSVVTSLVARRELRVYLADPEGPGFESVYTALELDTSVHALDTLESGRATDPLLAITDDGVAIVRWREISSAAELLLEPLLATATSLSGTGAFFSDFRFLHDLDGDGDDDLLLPTTGGWTVHRQDAAGFAAGAATLLEVPPPPDDGEEGEARGGEAEPSGDNGEIAREGATGEPDPDGGSRTGEKKATTAKKNEREVRAEPASPSGPPRPRQPRVVDVTRDGRPDLVLFAHAGTANPFVYVNLGRLRFAPAVELGPPGDRDHEEVVHIGDLDGRGPASIVAAEELEPDDEAGYKIHIEHAKEPDFVYRAYAITGDLRVAEPPRTVFRAEGYTFSGRDDDPADNDPEEDDVEVELPGGFKDLDGDGRQDMVAITLDFSLVPLIFRALVLGSISLRMDFHPYCQQSDGSFVEVPDLDLSGKFKINLRNVQVKHLSQFEGDFNGDGRADFIQLGRGRKVTIHQGGPGCTYPVEPDRRIRLAKEPKHLGLVRILDLDGDGMSDLYVVHPRKDPKSGETAPVRVDFYFGRGATG